MEDRKSALEAMRPVIPNAQVYISTGSEEYFQNKIARPIIKLQNDLLVAVFKNYIKKHKNHFHNLSLEKQLQYIEHAIHRDIKFRNSLKGIIIGMFTIEEYELYITNSSALNKRLMNIVIERLKDQIQLFTQENVA